jgi:hypothetical protein
VPIGINDAFYDCPVDVDSVIELDDPVVLLLPNTRAYIRRYAVADLCPGVVAEVTLRMARISPYGDDGTWRGIRRLRVGAVAAGGSRSVMPDRSFSELAVSDWSGGVGGTALAVIRPPWWVRMLGLLCVLAALGFSVLSLSAGVWPAVPVFAASAVMAMWRTWWPAVWVLDDVVLVRNPWTRVRVPRAGVVGVQEAPWGGWLTFGCSLQLVDGGRVRVDAVSFGPRGNGDGFAGLLGVPVARLARTRG